ncbi:MAG: TonB-dependent receptor plug domain-containing protein [Myxococcota bacterium]
MKVHYLLLLIALAPREARAQVDSSTATPSGDYSSRDTEVIFVTGGASALARAAGSAHLVDEAELERFEYDDVQRVLSRVPGVYVRDEDGFGLRPNIGIRGANSDRSQRVVLLEDGILLGPAPYAAPAAYFTPLATRMVGFEVFKGPAAVRTGPFTVGGAVNFLTANIPEDGHEGLADLAAGQFGYLKGHLRYGWGNDHVGFLVEEP